MRNPQIGRRSGAERRCESGARSQGRTAGGRSYEGSGSPTTMLGSREEENLVAPDETQNVGREMRAIIGEQPVSDHE